MANPCFPNDIKSFDFTTDEVRDLWAYSKANYIDRGVGFEDTIRGVASDLGLHPKWVAEAFTKPKAIRNVTNEIFKAQALRKEAIKNAKDYVRGLDTPETVKLLKRLWYLPRSALTFGHYAVFPVTHAGDLMLRPTAWKAYFKGAIDSWKFASKTAHEAARSAQQREPNYVIARRGGLDNDFSKDPVGILAGQMSGASRRGWDGLKVTRQKLFDKEWNRLNPEDQTLDMSRHISEAINHATGTTAASLGLANRLMFAPKLTLSKWMRAVVDPIKTVTTYAKMMSGKGGEVTAGEKAVAHMRVRNAAEYLAFYAGLLGVNQALLTVTDSKQKVNFTDPSKSDWLRFKIGGHVVNTRGAMEAIQLLGKLTAISFASKKQLRGESKQSAAASTVGRYAQYKLDPTLQLLAEVGYAQDIFGRPLPWAKEEGTKSKPKYTPLEYALEKGPIPLGAATREIYDTLRENGLSGADSTTLLRALAVGAFEGIGGGAYKEPVPKEKHVSAKNFSIRPASSKKRALRTSAE